MKTTTKPTFHPLGCRASCAKAIATIEQTHRSVRVISNQGVIRLIVAINHWFQTDSCEIGRGLVEYRGEYLRIVLAVTSDADDQSDFAGFRKLIGSLNDSVYLERDEITSLSSGNDCWYMCLKLTSGAAIDDLAATLVENAEASPEKSSVYSDGARVWEAIKAKERRGDTFQVSIRPINNTVTAYSIQSL